MSIVLTIIIFGIIVIIHEFGHFYAAKKCGVGIIEFAVGMGPKIFSRQKDDVLYSLRIFPLGGFCRMKGEEADDPDCFQNVSVIKRMIIVLAGPFMNFILAFIVFSFIMMFIPVTTSSIAEVQDGSPAYNAGIRADDRIVEMNNNSIRTYSDIREFMDRYDGSEIKIKIENSQGVKDIILTPAYNKEESRYIMGIVCKDKAPFFSKEYPRNERVGFFECLSNGFKYMIFMIKMTVEGLIKLVSAKIGLEQVSGPIGLTSAVGEVYTQAKQISMTDVFLSMMEIVGLLSANLGVMNLLPIPALDGGRFLFFVIEAVRRKPISPEKEGMVHLAGFALLMLFGVVVAFHDVMKFF